MKISRRGMETLLRKMKDHGLAEIIRPEPAEGRSRQRLVCSVCGKFILNRESARNILPGPPAHVGCFRACFDRVTLDPGDAPDLEPPKPGAGEGRSGNFTTT